HADVPAPGPATRDPAPVPPPSRPLRAPLPVLGPAGRPGIGISRSADRRIAFGGLALAAVFLALAAASILLPPSIRLGMWLPAHLALAGAATTAIAAILPFFTTALVVAPPARPAVRIAAICLVAFGALGAMTAWGHAPGEALPAAVAGGAFLAGLGLVAAAAFLPLRGALGPRRVLVERAYALALANVVVGATIATLLVGGNDVVGSAWGALKPAHAWLNLIGFVGLVIVASLLHLAPTVVGTRMRPRAAGRLAIVGLALGAPLVAAGYASSLDVVARAGAIAVLAAALGVLLHAVGVARDGAPGRWTTDPGWHRLTAGAMLGGQGWLAAGLGLAAGAVLASGANPAGWSLAIVVGPIVVGGVAQILAGAMTHLLPAIGPGEQLRHAAQRRILGRAATVRLVALNAGAALLTLGSWPAGAALLGAWSGLATGAGIAAAGLAIGTTLALLALASRRRPPVAAGEARR
ncbi:MAG TPA: hypothetical protein VFX65_03230, partial [Candidatus Limnocylindrales bacterium]|nr:hypothetical protein [Candidatus Limnocylindrales bacterium]